MPTPFWQQDPQDVPAPSPTFWTPPPPPKPEPEPTVPFWGSDDADDGIIIEALTPNGFAIPDRDEEDSDLRDVFSPDGESSINDVAAVIQISGLDPDAAPVAGPFDFHEGEDANAVVFILPRVDTQAEHDFIMDNPPELLFHVRPEEDEDRLHQFDTSIVVFEGLLDADDFQFGDIPDRDRELVEPIADVQGPSILLPVFGAGALFEVPESGEVTVLVMDGPLGIGGWDGTGDGFIDFSFGVSQDDLDDPDIDYELAPDVPNVFWGPEPPPLDVSITD